MHISTFTYTHLHISYRTEMNLKEIPSDQPTKLNLDDLRAEPEDQQTLDSVCLLQKKKPSWVSIPDKNTAASTHVGRTSKETENYHDIIWNSVYALSMYRHFILLSFPKPTQYNNYLDSIIHRIEYCKSSCRWFKLLGICAHIVHGYWTNWHKRFEHPQMLTPWGSWNTAPQTPETMLMCHTWTPVLFTFKTPRQRC